MRKAGIKLIGPKGRGADSYLQNNGGHSNRTIVMSSYSNDLDIRQQGFRQGMA